MPEQLTPRLLTVKSAANYSGVSNRTVENWITGKLVVSRKLCGRRLIEKDSLDAFIDQAERTPTNHETLC